MKDIKELENSLLSSRKVSGSKRVFQKLPRHKRRRAMSHNIHLLPKYLRKAGEIENQNVPHVVNRRRKRKKRKRYINKLTYIRSLNYDSPNEEFKKNQKKRLPTHLFHAKRMRMKNLWNFSIAHRSVHKVFRTSYRFYRQHCTIHDASYYICIQLVGKQENILRTLNSFRISNLLRTQKFLGGMCELKGLMYTKIEKKFVLLSPVKVMWEQKKDDGDMDVTGEKEEERKCWIWVHPASLPESFDLLKGEALNNNVDRIVYRNDLCRFEVRGKYATSTLKRPSVLFLDFAESGENRRVWEQVRSAGTMPKGMVLSLRIRHPLASAKPDFSITRKLVMNDSNGDEEKPLDFDKHFLSVPSGISQASELWTSKSGKEEIMNVRIDEEEEEEGEETILLEEKDKIHTVLLVQQFGGFNSTEFGYGWDLICSREVSVHIWGKISKSKNVLALSLVDRDRMLSEQGLLCFPSDYPDSFAFRRMNGEIVQEIYKHKKKKIPTVIKWDGILNFSKIFIERPPLSIPFINCEYYVKIEIILNFGGKIYPGSSLYLCCDDEELEGIVKNPISREFGDGKERMLIGFTTTGIHSLKRGKGYGIGYGKKTVFEKIPRKKFIVTLLKNIHSNYTTPVKCKCLN